MHVLLRVPLSVWFQHRSYEDLLSEGQEGEAWEDSTRTML
jgi:hypothetical protein